MKVLLLILLAGFGGSWHVMAQAEKQPSATNQVNAFELSDQNGRMHRCQFGSHTITILLMADRRGADQIEGWVEALKKRYGGRVALEGVADVSSVPAPLRSLVRSRLKEKFTYPIMLDWEGKVVAQFPLARKVANLFLVDQRGRIVMALQGVVDSSKLERLTAAVEEQLPRPRTGAPQPSTGTHAIKTAGPKGGRVF